METSQSIFNLANGDVRKAIFLPSVCFLAFTDETRIYRSLLWTIMATDLGNNICYYSDTLISPEKGAQQKFAMRTFRS